MNIDEKISALPILITPDETTYAAVVTGEPPVNRKLAVTYFADQTNFETHTGDTDVHLTPEQNILLDNITVNANEINQLDGVTSNIQDQLDATVKNVLPGYAIEVSGETVSVKKSVLDTLYSAISHLHTQYLTGFTETDPIYVSEKPTLALKTDLNVYSLSGHTHDDRYYTETEINNLLIGKSNTGHTHAQYLTVEIDPVYESEKYLYSLTGHTHNQYLTEELDPIYESEKYLYSHTGHTHSQYLTEFTELDPIYESEKYLYSLTGHTHDDRYYTEGEVDTLLLGKSATGHTHSQYQETLESGINIKTINNQDITGGGNLNITGATVVETDPIFVASEAYSITSGDTANWDAAYGWGNHANAGYLTEALADGFYSKTGHTHNQYLTGFTELDPVYEAEKYLYSLTGHTHNQYLTEELDPVYESEKYLYSLTGHTHDDRYYTEGEVDTLLDGKSDTGHTHDSTYVKLSAVADEKGMTGFIDGNNITVSYNHTDKTITLNGPDLSYLWRGVKYTLGNGLTWTSTGHTGTAGEWHLYSTDGINFVWAQTDWSFTDCQVASVIYNPTASLTFALKETHGLMDAESHQEFHNQIGTYLLSGGKLSVGTYAENTFSNAATTPGFDLAVIKDEDCNTSLSLWSEGTYTTMYVSGTTSIFNIASSYPFTNTTATYINVNNPTTGALTAGQSNRYYNVYQILLPTAIDSNSTKYRMIMLQPQATYTTLLAAQAEDVRTLNLGSLMGLTEEFVIFARMTYWTQNQANIGKCTIATGGVSYLVGSKLTQISVSGIVGTNHAALNNLNWLGSAHYGNVNTIAAFDVSGNATELPNATFSASGHTHTQYLTGETNPGVYTSGQTDMLLVSKSNTGHTHTGIYAPVLGVDDNYVTDNQLLIINDSLTKTEASTTYSPTGHTHDDRYYTEGEVDTLLLGKSATGHTHTGIYAPVLGADDNYVTDAQLVVIQNTSNTNSGDETTISLKTKLDTTYSQTGHTHTQYLTGYTETNPGVYTSGQTDTLLAGKSATGHTHTGVYLPINTPNAVTATTYTFVIGDAFKLVSFGSGSATSVTVPPNSGVTFSVGTQVDCVQLGVGTVTFVAGAGVTINSLSSNKKINGQYVGVSLVKTDTNTWLLVGNLIA